MTYNPLDPQADPFRPPEIPVEVECLHCGRQYDSYLIEWRVETSADGKPHGFWCCPTPGCDGRGFGFDILPTDPDYQDERGGWVSDDEDDEENYDEEWDEPENGDAEDDFWKPPDSDNHLDGLRPSGPDDDDIPF